MCEENREMRHVVFGLYGCLVLLLVVSTWVSLKEHFEDLTEAQCFECMSFFSDVFQFNDPAQIVPYTKRRADFLTSVLNNFDAFITTNYTQCLQGKANITAQEVATCFQQEVARMNKMCTDNGLSLPECAIIQTLGDQVVSKALMCGAKDCTVEMFRKRFQEVVAALRRDLERCRVAFQSNEDRCVQMYRSVIEMKTKIKPTDTAEDARPVTQKEMRNMMSDMATFAMNMS
jgi:hypothetical protein